MKAQNFKTYSNFELSHKCVFNSWFVKIGYNEGPQSIKKIYPVKIFYSITLPMFVITLFLILWYCTEFPMFQIQLQLYPSSSHIIFFHTYLFSKLVIVSRGLIIHVELWQEIFIGSTENFLLNLVKRPINLTFCDVKLNQIISLICPF